MLSAIRNPILRASSRAFSTTSTVRSDMAKLVLIGRLGGVPEAKMTKNEKEYVQYNVATTNYPPPPPDADGIRPPSTTSWHTVFCFNGPQCTYLKTIPKGSQVYVEAAFELRDVARDGSDEREKKIFLRHENVRVLTYKKDGDKSE